MRKRGFGHEGGLEIPREQVEAGEADRQLLPGTPQLLRAILRERRSPFQQAKEQCGTLLSNYFYYGKSNR